MAKQKTEHLTRLELEIMNVLWDEGAANVQSVQHRLDRDLAYTTVQTMLNILLRKGKVKRALKERAYVYKPAVTRRQFVSRHLGDRLFGGSAESLVISLVEAKHLKPQTLARLNKLLKEQEGKADENS